MNTLFYFLRRFLKKILFNLKIYIGQLTEHQKITELYNVLKPLNHKFELIKIGEDGAGGYFIPKDLDNIEYCLTAGVGNLIQFEKDLADMGIKCYMADASVEKPPISHERFFFKKKYIGPNSSKDYITLKKWIDETPIKEHLEKTILKIDIEGGEYDIFDDVDQKIIDKFPIIIMEFHHLNSLLSPLSFELINKVFNKILKNHFVIANIPNKVIDPVKYNSNLEIFDMIELTLLRKDKI